MLAKRLAEIVTSAAAPEHQIVSKSQPRIGAALELTRRELVGVGQALCDVLEPAGINLAEEALRLLRQQSCKIAVIGQIKAGKSSFINALVQQPGLLPTDVNPSTSTVTHLHFNQTSSSGAAALFHFFDEKEWDRLVNGDGHLRELTQRLVPGFEPTLLRRHAAAVMERASRRLGGEFNALLGQSHAYRSTDRDTLKKYICAGEALPDQDETGLYSEITRAADLYFAGGPFDFPVTIIDTPGTNDPFLLRDEITRSCLDKADAYIVVLTAHQPLSEGDVSLLRLLRGLNKERIGVFINRIDELADVEGDTPRIVQYVRDRLAIELPGADIPIVAGSAKWGMTGPAPKRASGTVTPKPGTGASTTDSGPRANSGMAEINTVLDRLLESSHCAYVERQITSSFLELSRTSEQTLRHDIEGLRSTHAWAETTAGRMDGVLAEINAEHERLGELQRFVDSSAATFDDTLHGVMQLEVDGLRSRLTAIVDRHASEERDALVSLMHIRQAPRLWRTDAGTLRRDLAHAFHTSFRQAESRMIDISGRFAARLRDIADTLSTGAAPNVEPHASLFAIAAPNPTPVGKPVSLDLDASWWTRLWRARPGPHERGAAIEQLVKAEFHPVAEALADSQQQALAAYIAATTDWTHAVAQSISQTLQRRRDQLAIDYLSLTTSIEGCADAATRDQQTATLASLEQRLHIARAATARLERISTHMDCWFH